MDTIIGLLQLGFVVTLSMMVLSFAISITCYAVVAVVMAIAKIVGHVRGVAS
jgi:hypothetical protein